MSSIPSSSNLPPIIQVYQDANALMRQYGLIDLGWRFDLSNEKQTLGRCSYKSKLITLSKYYLDDYEQVLDTIKHEIAHALVPKGQPHGYEWRQMARKVGAIPKACAVNAVSTAKPNYIIRCGNPACGQEWPAYRLRKQHRYTHCGVPVKISEVVK